MVSKNVLIGIAKEVVKYRTLMADAETYLRITAYGASKARLGDNSINNILLGYKDMRSMFKSLGLDADKIAKGDISGIDLTNSSLCAGVDAVKGHYSLSKFPDRNIRDIARLAMLDELTAECVGLRAILDDRTKDDGKKIDEINAKIEAIDGKLDSVCKSLDADDPSYLDSKFLALYDLSTKTKAGIGKVSGKIISKIDDVKKISNRLISRIDRTNRLVIQVENKVRDAEKNLAEKIEADGDKTRGHSTEEHEKTRKEIKKSRLLTKIGVIGCSIGLVISLAFNGIQYAHNIKNSGGAVTPGPDSSYVLQLEEDNKKYDEYLNYVYEQDALSNDLIGCINLAQESTEEVSLSTMQKYCEQQKQIRQEKHAKYEKQQLDLFNKTIDNISKAEIENLKTVAQQMKQYDRNDIVTTSNGTELNYGEVTETANADREQAIETINKIKDVLKIRDVENENEAKQELFGNIKDVYKLMYGETVVIETSSDALKYVNKIKAQFYGTNYEKPSNGNQDKFEGSSETVEETNENESRNEGHSFGFD